MAAVSVDDLSGASGVVEQLGIPFPVLYDTSTQVPRTYGVFNLLGDGLAAPATFIVNTDGVITWKYVASQNYDHASVSSILGQLSS